MRLGAVVKLPALWSAGHDPCDDRAVPTLFASYLLVYEPLSAFDKQRQVYWRRYVHDGRAVTPVEGPGRQRTAVIEALVARMALPSYVLVGTAFSAIPAALPAATRSRRGWSDATPLARARGWR